MTMDGPRDAVLPPRLTSICVCLGGVEEREVNEGAPTDDSEEDTDSFDKGVCSSTPLTAAVSGTDDDGRNLVAPLATIVDGLVRNEGGREADEGVRETDAREDSLDSLIG